jgi:translocation and assembly module TamB
MNRLNSNESSRSVRSSQRSHWVKYGVVLLTGGVVVGGVIGWQWVQNFISNDLRPLIETSLSNLLQRPVQIGNIESYSWNHLRVGASQLPPTPGDRDYIRARAIEVTFNPLALLTTRTLRLHVKLKQPRAYFDQNQQGQWLVLKLKEGQAPSPIRIQLDSAEMQGAIVTLVPRPDPDQRPQPLIVKDAAGLAWFRDNHQRIQFQVQGRPTTSGQFAVGGNFFPKTQQFKLQARGQQLSIPWVDALIQLPWSYQAGQGNVDLTVQITPKQPVLLAGTAQLQNVTLKIPELPKTINQARGQVRFQGKTILLETAEGRYGLIPARLRGVADPDKGLNLAGQVQSVAINDAQNTLDVQFPFPTTGQIGVDLKLTGAFTKPVLSGSVRSVQEVQVDRVPLRSLSANFRFADSVVSFSQINAIPTPGGQVTGTGNIQLAKNGRLEFTFQGDQLPGDAIATLYNAKPGIQLNTVSTQVQVNSPLAIGQPFDPTAVQTTVQWQAPQATYPASGELLVRSERTASPNTYAQVAVGTVTLQPNVQIDKVAFKTVAARFQYANDTQQLSLQAIEASPLVGGRMTGRGELDLSRNGSLTLQLVGEQLPGDAIARLYGATLPIQIGTITAMARINSPLSSERPFDPAAVKTTVAWQAPNATYPAKGDVLVAGYRTLIRNTALQVAQGTVEVTGHIQQNRWQGITVAQGVRLQAFSPDLRGVFSGRLTLSGTTDAFAPEAIRAKGIVGFSQGLALITNPITAHVQWDGQRIMVPQATAQGFRADGTVLARFEGQDAPQITGYDLNIMARNYNLKTLEIEKQLPYIDLSGSADFTGRVNGTLARPIASGTLTLNGLDFNEFAFESKLFGKINFDGRTGLNFEVKGQRDRIALELDATNRPVAFAVQRDQAITTGKTQGNQLLAQVNNFPLHWLQIPPDRAPPRWNTVNGQLDGQLAFNWQQGSALGEATIARPQVGPIMAERLTTQFQYANQSISLSRGELKQLGSDYAFQGYFDITPKRDRPQFQAQVLTNKARVQDVLTVAQWFDPQQSNIGQFAKAADVQPFPVGLPDGATLHAQLQRFSEVLALQEQQNAQTKTGLQIPPLDTLTGNFQGDVQAYGSWQKGIKVDFNLRGSDWNWGENYRVQGILARGRWEPSGLTLAPIQLKANPFQATFTGNVGGRTQTGDLVVENLPLSTVQNFLNLPVKANGSVSGTASLGGSFENPQAKGELQLQDGEINAQTLQSAQGTFNYQDGRLAFQSQAAIAQPEPVYISGEIPLPLPFAKVEPVDPQISLDVNVQNEGLALMNLATDVAQWVNGQGQLQVQVRGTLDQPIANGVAEIKNATFTAPSLPEPLKAVTGRVLFDGSLVQVEQLAGQFSQGVVSAKGVIPLAGSPGKRITEKEPVLFLPIQPLEISLEQLNLNLPGLYKGETQGQLVIGGSVLEPVLGGELKLANGQITLPEETEASEIPSEASLGVQSGDLLAANPTSVVSEEDDIAFSNLKLGLGDRVFISGPGLKFLATGDLTLNGSYQDPLPQGTIELTRGQVNIYTTLFTLDRTSKNTAVFKERQGLDPTLDVRMTTSIPEVTRAPLPESPIVSSEIAILPSTTLGALQTVQIQAYAKGQASQIIDNLELKSSPARTQNEIISLLGGGFVGTLGRGDSGLSLANLASTALLNNLQAFIGQSFFGFTDFRIFPAIIPRKDKTYPSTIDIVTEIGIPITRNFSTSVLSVLTDRDPFALFNLRYRFNDQLQLRGATDFAGESRATFEYETRF